MSTTWSWIILIIAGLCETGFAFCLGKMKLVTGTAWWLWGTGFAVFVVVSMVLLGKAAQVLPIGTAYPVWTGIGAVGAVAVSRGKLDLRPFATELMSRGLDAKDALLAKAETVRENMEDMVAEAHAVSEQRKAKAGEA